jgi:hypothetical protein
MCSWSAIVSLIRSGPPSSEKHCSVLFIGAINFLIQFLGSGVSKSLFLLLWPILGRPGESLWSGDGESHGAPAVAHPAGDNGRCVVVVQRLGDDGCAGDELGHAGDAPAATIRAQELARETGHNDFG